MGRSKWYGDQVLRRMQVRAGMNMMRATIICENEAKSLVSKAGKGRVYKRRRRGAAGKRTGNQAYIIHQASAPFDPWSTDSGSLRSRTTHKIEHVRGLTWKGAIGGRDARFEMLEYGTSRIEPRPTLRTAIHNKKKEVLKELGRDLT